VTKDYLAIVTDPVSPSPGGHPHQYKGERASAGGPRTAITRISGLFWDSPGEALDHLSLDPLGGATPIGKAARVIGAISYLWRGAVTDDEMVDLIGSHGGKAVVGWWDQIRPHSLGWVSARSAEGLLVGFVNVAWDGADHAFLIDTKTRGSHQRQGIGSEVVRRAAIHAKAAGCEWLHVDFGPDLARFYFDACGFRPTEAGLIHLPSLT